MTAIVVIDDEKEWLELYGEGLGANGHAVRTFGDGRAALLDMDLEVPDVVVLDIRMAPSGRDVLRSIRRRWPGLPVVVASSYVGYRDDPDFAFDRVDAFLEKSTDLTELFGTIEYVLSKREGAGRRADA